MYDVIIIGAGVVGCALARKLSQYNGAIAVLDAAEDVADGASKANSGIVHAGFDAKPGTKKAYYNVRGANMYAQLAKELGVPYNPIGALVLGFSEEDREPDISFFEIMVLQTRGLRESTSLFFFVINVNM